MKMEVVDAIREAEMAEGLRNSVAGEIFFLRVGKKKIADYLACSPRLAGRSW